MVKLALTVPAPDGLNWMVRGWVFPGASENETGPPTRLKAEPLGNCSTVPESIPRPAFPISTVLLVMLPRVPAIEIRAGLESLPGSTMALSAMLTFRCSGSPLMMGILCVAIPSASGVKVIVIGMLASAVSVYGPMPVTWNGPAAAPTSTDSAEVRLRLRINTVLDIGGIPIPIEGKRTASGTLNEPPGGSAIGVGVGVAPIVIVSVGVGAVVIVAVVVGVGSTVAVLVAVPVGVGVRVPVDVAV